jgi:acyl-[acyl-carrier-protein]-phospholipid O-acyltransferase/long-chain-fatty-acid--[acyl-carrier-protein] ligase
LNRPIASFLARLPLVSHDDSPLPSAPAADDPREGLLSRSFLGLLCTQLLGALNDNMFRWMIVPIGKELFARQFSGAEYDRLWSLAEGGAPDAVSQLKQLTAYPQSLALSLGSVCLVLPFVLLAAPAGYLGDRFSKRNVIVGCKVAEVVLVLAGAVAIWLGSVEAMFVVLLLMGCQAALFGPSKMGSIPEIVKPDRISAANGLVALTTVIAIILGALAGGYLHKWSWTHGTGLTTAWLPPAALIGVAVLGWMSSLLIRRLPSANPALEFPRNPVGKTWADLKTIASTRPLLRVALGIAFFWSVAALAQMTLDPFGVDELGLEQAQVGNLLGMLSIGVGIGSGLAGYWSAGRVELGIVPLGALGIAVCSMALFVPDFVYPAVMLPLFLLGASAGLFDVPLNSYMQHRSPERQRGAILAASNFLTFGGMLLASGLFWLLRGPLGLNARQIFLLTGLATVPVFLYIVFLLPYATIRFVIWLASHTLYRLRVQGREHLPASGGALLVANHMTWLDGVFLLLSSSRPIRMVALAQYVNAPWIRWLARLAGVIPIEPGRKSMLESLRLAREAVQSGELVCIFPEGRLSRSGTLHEFKRGLLSIIDGTDAPVVPVYLDELWGSIFSYHRGKFFWKRPIRWPYPVSIHFGPPVPAPVDVTRARRAVAELGAQAVQQRKDRAMILPRAMLRQCRRNFFRPKIADSTGAELTGGAMLLKTLVLRRLLDRALEPDDRFVGLLLPPSVAGVLANAALTLQGRIGVNLNYTASPEVVNACMASCGIRRIVSSRKVLESELMEKFRTGLKAEYIYLEDFKDQVTLADKLAAAVATYATPVALLERLLGLTRIKPDDLLTIVFTSGSTGEPKGVMLSHHNIASNVLAVDQVIHLSKQDVAIGVLPFFHSFGYTATLWTVLALDPKGVYHFSPLDAQKIGKLAGKHRVTLLMAAPTFLRGFVRRCQKEDFASLEVVVTGAEKLPPDVAEAFESKFGVRPVEGYGVTELSPVVAVNIPPSRAQGEGSAGLKEGTVGRPLPGVVAKVVNPDTFEELPPGTSGMLLVQGPNVMRGYYNRPDLTAQALRDGWYVTGDIAEIDAEGFIKITGRQSRFSKIGGEMVPHILVEETLQQILAPDGEELKAAVTAVADPRKGERLVVLHLPLELDPGEISKRLAAAGLPNLWIPAPDSFFQVEHIPLLGSGKLDLKQLKLLAEQLVAGDTAAGNGEPAGQRPTARPAG